MRRQLAAPLRFSTIQIGPNYLRAALRQAEDAPNRRRGSIGCGGREAHTGHKRRQFILRLAAAQPSLCLSLRARPASDFACARRRVRHCPICERRLLRAQVGSWAVVRGNAAIRPEPRGKADMPRRRQSVEIEPTWTLRSTVPVGRLRLGIGAARKAHREYRALAQLAGHRHLAPHHARELAGDGKA
jgi:hypothetical protein